MPLPRAAVDKPRPEYDLDNVFRKIVSGAAKAHIVLETEHALGFLDAFPVRACPS